MIVKLGKPELRGVDPDARGLLVVHVPVEPTPDEPWAEMFGHPPEHGHPTSMHRPQVVVDRIELQVVDGQLTETIAKLRERVACTNGWHEQQIEPEYQRRRAQKRAAAEAEQKRLTDAQRELDNFDWNDEGM